MYMPYSFIFFILSSFCQFYSIKHIQLAALLHNLHILLQEPIATKAKNLIRPVSFVLGSEQMSVLRI